MKKILLIIIFALCSGCATTYKITADPATGKIVSVQITSRREFKDGLTVKYNKETGSFEFTAGSVSNGVSPLETAAAQLMLELPSLLNPLPHMEK